jgi:hypothetical protein
MLKEVAVALPYPRIDGDDVVVVAPTKGRAQTVNGDALRLLRILPSLFNLANQIGVHATPLSSIKTILLSYQI